MKTSITSLVFCSALLPSALGVAIPTTPPATEVIPGVSVGGGLIDGGKRDIIPDIADIGVGDTIIKKSEAGGDGAELKVPGLTLISDRAEDDIIPNIADIGAGDTIIKRSEKGGEDDIAPDEEILGGIVEATKSIPGNLEIDGVTKIAGDITPEDEALKDIEDVVKEAKEEIIPGSSAVGGIVKKGENEV